MTVASAAAPDSFRIGMLLSDTRYRGYTIQVIAFFLLMLFFGWLITNTINNLAALGKEFGFGFLRDPASYDINQRLIEYTSRSSHARAAVVGHVYTPLADDDLQLQRLLFIGRRRLGRHRQIQLQDGDSGKHRADEQERNQHHHQVHEGGDVQLLGLITATLSKATPHGSMPTICWRLRVVRLANRTVIISRLSTNSLVLVWTTAWASNNGMATIRPNAVVFIATEILADNNSAFSAGLALETAVNASMRPMIVPSSPSRVARFAKVAR